jgi:hypothetical protein
MFQLSKIHMMKIYDLVTFAQPGVRIHHAQIDRPAAWHRLFPFCIIRGIDTEAEDGKLVDEHFLNPAVDLLGGSCMWRHFAGSQDDAQGDV